MTTVSEKKSEFLTTTQACQYLGVTNATLVNWAKQLGVKSYPGPKNTRNYRREDIELIQREKGLPHAEDEEE